MATVLLVDDDPDLLEVLGLLMEHEGLAHVDAHSLAEVEALGPVLDRLDLAILDVNLGSGQPTGLDIHAWLRARGVTCRVVFLTGHAPEHPLVQEAAGMDQRVLVKPLDTSELIGLVKELA